MVLPLNKQRILVFAPSFFGYEKEIVNKLKELGAIVDFYDTRYTETTLGKAIMRIQKNLITNIINRHYKKILLEIENKEYDVLLFFRADPAPRWFNESLNKKYPNAQKVLYIWDSVVVYPTHIEDIDLYDEVFSHDPVDCKQHNLKLRPLFYRDDYLVQNNITPNSYEYDFSFVGAARKDRYLMLENLKVGADKKKQRYFIFYYLHSELSYLFFKYISRDFPKSKKSDFAFSPLNHEEIQKVMASSKVVVDVHHPKQAGLTMRTIEFLASKKKFVTTNKEILKYDFFNENNIGILNRENPEIEAEFLNSEYQNISGDILERYSLGYFLLEILGKVPCGDYYDLK